MSACAQLSFGFHTYTSAFHFFLLFSFRQPQVPLPSTPSTSPFHPLTALRCHPFHRYSLGHKKPAFLHSQPKLPTLVTIHTHTSTMKFATAVVFLVALVASASAHMAILYPPPRGGIGTPQYNGRIHVSTLPHPSTDQFLANNSISSGYPINSHMPTTLGIHTYTRAIFFLQSEGGGQLLVAHTKTFKSKKEKIYADTHTTHQYNKSQHKHNVRQTTNNIGAWVAISAAGLRSLVYSTRLHLQLHKPKEVALYIMNVYSSMYS